MMRRPWQAGFTLIEFMVSMVLGAMIITVIATVVAGLAEARDSVQDRGRLAEAGHFAMTRMVTAVRESRHLVLPQQDKPATNWRENVRDQSVPAVAPEGSSIRATAVLAVSLSAAVDLDADGIPDADNDRDGRLDEDYPADANFDAAPGILGIDDGGNGFVDESLGNNRDDDERLATGDEDAINGIDDDGDGLIDDDPPADMNADGAAGIFGVDDDSDGLIDEGGAADDDEDGRSNEDWLDTVVFYLRGSDLLERHPVPWDENNDSAVTGRDFVESVIANNVSRFRVERVSASSGIEIVDIRLELLAPTSADTVILHTRVRAGAAP